MSHENQNGMLAVDEGTESIDDTTYTKIFVGGLAWKTENETMKDYFQQFGEIFEAVVIYDKRTGKSKGYGFVTFKDPESAMRACQDPNPVIDGRQANCNLAYLGANRNRAVDPDQQGMEKASPTRRFMQRSINGHQFKPHYSYPHSAYGYPYYPQYMSTMNYYNAYGGQQFPSYYNSVASGSPGVYYYNYYPFYGQHGQTSSTQNPKIIQYPYFSQQQHSSYGMSRLPISSSSPSTSTAGLPATQQSAGEGASNDQEERPSA